MGPLKVKVAHTRLSSVGFRSWSRFLAVSLQVMRVINPAVGCHYLCQACSYPRNPQEGCYQFCCLVNRGTMGVNSLPKTVSQQRSGCDLNPGPSAPESSMLRYMGPLLSNKPNSNVCSLHDKRYDKWRQDMVTKASARNSCRERQWADRLDVTQTLETEYSANC